MGTIGEWSDFASRPSGRDDIIDRRGATGGRRGGVAIGAGGGGIAIIIAILFALFGVVGAAVASRTSSTSCNRPQPPPAKPTRSIRPPIPRPKMADFMSVVLDDNQAMWADVFTQSGRAYQNAELVFFTGFTESGCGGADSRMGPHYCPLDNRVYLDLEFFEELRTRFGATGDLAPAYVLAHEIGHHVQNLLGTDDQVRELQQQDPARANELSVRMELQADCFAGVWASTVFVGQLETGEDIALDPGEISEALEAAAAVGDDRIQADDRGQGRPRILHPWHLRTAPGVVPNGLRQR